ncbi:hypothetical protein EGM88_06000 [Aureibaculum marinum]|uniref:Sigma-70 family RNA polymerase sigma factor n=1 Tax=Aureibaculum marinum TaxID=2487930 RepID=A0A3N4P2C1_9FLAO|nr:sigma-70 family RNA polymerase sigma factor [Aureibaculum marinum]RPD98740.1 hypothetical protein EGM88_06000 [Aureibaculum marinum]
MITQELSQLRKENNFDHFYEKILAFEPSLKEFISRKLHLAENLGIIDKKFYKPNDILDDVYLEVFNNFNNKINAKDLRKKLFIKSVEKIDEKTILGHQLDNHINSDKILKEELQTLNEKYTVDGDGDFILYDELDDISYHQDDFKPSNLILDDSLEKLMLEKLNLENSTLESVKKKKLFGGLFYNLPPASKSIIELHIYGNQSVEDISEIMNIQRKMVEQVIESVKEKFKLIL